MANSIVPWKEVYLTCDLYSAWFRVFARWLYAEGIFCTPTTTVSARSAAEASTLEKAWSKSLDGASARVVGNDVVALHGESFELEEAQSYTEAIQALRGAAGRRAVIAPVYSGDPGDFPESVQAKLERQIGEDWAEAEDGAVVSEALILALLRDLKSLPKNLPMLKMAVSGTVASGGLSGVRVESFDGGEPLDVTEVMGKAVADTLAFMKDYGIKGATFWFSDEIQWKAPNASVAKVIARLIAKCQGSAKAAGDRILGPAGEIWSVVSWLKHGRWGKVYSDYGASRNDPRIPELLGEQRASKGRFAGEVVCFTGKLESMERDDARAIVEDEGGRTASTVTSDLTLLVAARDSSSKRAKAEKRGIAIIDEKAFLKRAGR